jgi:hypothetical protein
MDQTGPAFRHLTEKFPGISAAEIKGDVFALPQMCQLFSEKPFDCILSGNEKRAWNYFRLLATNFMGYNRADNYNELVESLLFSYQKLRCSIPFKIIFLHYDLDIFPENCATAKGEHGETFIMIPQHAGDIPGQMNCSDSGGLLLDIQKSALDLCTNDRRRGGAINQDKPGSTHSVTDIV